MNNKAIARRRNKWGTLEGGEQNESMQKYVDAETFEAKEHKRWIAHRDAALHVTFPTELNLNGIGIPIFKMSELEQLGQRRLRERTLNTRDLVQATKSNFFQHYPELQLNSYAQPDVLMKWMIDIQVKIAAAVGYDDLDHAAFGASASESAALPTQVPRQGRTHAANAPCWSQDVMLREASSPKPRTSPSRQSFPWSQYGVTEEQPMRTPGDWRHRPPEHDGFSLVPPSMMQVDNSASYASDIIRQRAHGSVISLG